MVLLDLVRDRGVGPGFLTDKQRLNVPSTRHQDFLFVIGDSMTSADKPSSSLSEWLNWFGVHGRRVDAARALQRM